MAKATADAKKTLPFHRSIRGEFAAIVNDSRLHDVDRAPLQEAARRLLSLIARTRIPHNHRNLRRYVRTFAGEMGIFEEPCVEKTTDHLVVQQHMAKARRALVDQRIEQALTYVSRPGAIVEHVDGRVTRSVPGDVTPKHGDGIVASTR